MNTEMQNIINPDLNMRLLKNDIECGKSFVTLRSKKFSLPCTKIVLTKSTSDSTLFSSPKDGMFHTEISPNVQSINEIQASENRKPVDSHLQNVFDILRKDVCLFCKSFIYYGKKLLRNKIYFKIIFYKYQHLFFSVTTSIY